MSHLHQKHARRLDPDVRRRVIARDKKRCRYCHRLCQLVRKGRSKRPDTLTLDHVIPIARGGQSTEENLVVACAECNKLKGDSLDAPVRRQRFVDLVKQHGYDAATALVARWRTEDASTAPR